MAFSLSSDTTESRDEMNNIKNIALMAHVDAGKTTLTEQVLFRSGAIRELGSVDKGTAKTDDLPIERQRGISVRAALTSFYSGGDSINLIDTPGHSDFYSQVERTFLAVDAVVILVSAVDGVQSGTEQIMLQAYENDMPVLFFINKCDRDIARIEETIAQIKAIRKGTFDYANERYETAALYDDGVMQALFDGKAEDVSMSDRILAEKVKTCEVSPIVCGSAFTGDGVDELLEVITKTVPSQQANSAQTEAAGVVFSVIHDKVFGRGAYIRLYAGRISVRDVITVNGAGYKVTMIRQMSEGKWVDKKDFADIALVYGLSDCKTGDVFGDREKLPLRVSKGLTVKALLTVQIIPENKSDNTKLKSALEMLTAEDPTLDFSWEPTCGEIHINVMGVMQIEILSALIEERFGLKVTAGKPAVIYKETLAKPAIGFDAYTMPKPCWAVLKFRLTPAQRGSGITYTCTVAPNKIGYRYRGQVEFSIAPSLKQGLYGWEVVDMNIELIDGEDHPIHTHPLDFSVATPLALMDGLRNGGTTLLEPILDVKFTFHKQHLGRIMSDVIRMRGEVEPAVYRDSEVTLSAKVPLASSLDYPVTFASVTSGAGIMTQRLHGYRECPLELGAICPRRGVDPSDRSKYILAARSALSGTVFT